MTLQRYMRETIFCDELRKLRAYPGLVGLKFLPHSPSF